MKIIGLTGNTGSGKSSICKILEDLGAFIICADELSHKVILSGEPAYAEITELFGGEILNESREIDRKKLGAIVFADKKKLDALSKIIHYYVIKETENIIAQERSRSELIVIDAPLLVEAGMHKICDEVWLANAGHDIRLDRIMRRDGLTEQEALLRMNSQTSFDDLMPYATRVIYNDSTFEELLKQVKNVLCD